MRNFKKKFTIICACQKKVVPLRRICDILEKNVKIHNFN